MIVTDDGLQHYKLARDREIVVIDGVRRFGNGWWLPAGPMRERASRLQSVDAVIVNGGVARPGEIPMRLRPWMAVNLLTGERRDVSTFTNVVAMAGIGHPPRFFATLESCGVQPVKTVALADHQALSQLMSPPRDRRSDAADDRERCREMSRFRRCKLVVFTGRRHNGR